MLALWRPGDYALTLLAEADIPWEPDPLRSHPEQRDWLLGLYQAELARQGVAYTLLQGGQAERLAQAWQALGRAGLPKK
ncbi:hypothetical protein [Pseudomonas sp. MWU12-2115]|uniref:hypothetical protein n=1 Tax=Pseudomonas sp. MWU12-2115 TaxID=2071713 RepID=UPI0015AEAF95